MRLATGIIHVIKLRASEVGVQNSDPCFYYFNIHLSSFKLRVNSVKYIEGLMLLKATFMSALEG